jgi:hypothetical protein
MAWSPRPPRFRFGQSINPALLVVAQSGTELIRADEGTVPGGVGQASGDEDALTGGDADLAVSEHESGLAYYSSRAGV